ncbi:MAG TPA: hypothetical protein VGE26_04230 [Sphingobacteriaceae bacterium]
MQHPDQYINRHPQTAFYILLILAVPAFFINLGLLALFADEPTRANVALEMILTNNYSVPTIGGEYYYNKPPFYNWILAGVYLLTGSFSEFVTRLPALVPMFLFAITIFYSTSWFLKDKRVAAVSGLLFLVNGRMLVYDSMLGHIDIFYSWLTFIAFIAIFYFYQREQWFWLFFVSYVITSVTFLSKGLPSIVFQGFTIIALLIYTRNFKKLFSWQHIVCGIFCLLLIGAYFYNYSQYNPALGGYLTTIWDQSSQRTATKVGFWPSVKHIILFPFEHLGHLIPASLLALFCFHKSFWKGIMQNGFLKFITITFLANIWVYWLSPETRPRYLLMLYPLLFIIWSYSYFTWREKLPKTNKVFDVTLVVLAVLVTLAVPSAFFFDLQSVPYLPLKVAVTFLMCLGFTYLICRLRASRIFAFIGLLITVRLAFSWFILPHRAAGNAETYFRSAAIEMGRISDNKPFYFYQYHPHVASIPFHDRLIFYIQRTKMQQVKFTESDAKPGYYLTFDRNLKNPKAVLVKSYRDNLKLFEVK